MSPPRLRLFRRDADLSERRLSGFLALPEEPQQEVLGPDHFVNPQVGFFLGEHDDYPLVTPVHRGAHVLGVPEQPVTPAASKA